MRSKRAVKELMQQRQQDESAAHTTTTHVTEQRDADDDIPTAIATPIATPIPTATATAIPVRPPNPDPPERDFSPVAEMARLIASYPNGELSPPPVCSATNCHLGVCFRSVRRSLQTFWEK